MLEVQLMETSGDVELPVYATKGSAGFDLKVNNFKQLWEARNINQAKPTKTEEEFVEDETQSIMLNPHSRLLVGCGFRVAVPEGYEMQVRSRSGNALKKGLTVLNSPGTIDSDYRGEVGVILINTSNFDVEVSLGDAVAQGIIAKVEQVRFNKVDELTETKRGEGGFGSTDLKDQANRV